ncbi:DUF1932 domain-containing protein [Luteipulveratus sp. YIM 133132]|uniref:NAD(P)-dependent oxidoreductase n=1 Tax=Luteipulveratus flavus TaxID=3031728 RepID=UPI0023AF87E3|nr:NAD(P)-dependent oxidoreductase [Luteipulveratus sp. YIM 133132]MDE9367301.1 DUF1932 domain-containing protein [Luteipulveratus sp. YIM 133132]
MGVGSGPVGLLHPGAMGAAVGACLVRAGAEVLWASQDRSDATAARAREAGLTDVRTVDALLERAGIVLSICPPHAALATAALAHDFGGVYVDANAVSPGTVREVAGLLPRARFVDGGIVGSPPTHEQGARLYLSGPSAPDVAELFAGTTVECLVLSGGVGVASALKMAYASWTKGSAALLLTARDLARAEGVEDELANEWAYSLPHLADRLAAAERSAATKGWRWVGEMEEIATTMREAGLPDGFHQAAAVTYRRYPRPRS